MLRKRLNNGRFTTCTDDKDEDSPIAVITMPISRGSLTKVMIIFLILLVVSPWIYLILRRNGIGSISQRISDFYDDNFSCNSQCLASPQNRTSSL